MAISVKNINTRLTLKYDSYDQWLLHDPILLTGEVAIATLPASENKAGVGEPNAEGSTPAIQNAPNLLIKVGDGQNHYKDLKFVSALAADVYSWAKAATPPVYKAEDIEGLSDYIGDQIQDTDTQYQIVAIEEGYSYKLQSKAKGTDTWSDVEGSTINLTNIDARLDALESAIGEGGSVQDKIDASIADLNYSGKAADQGKFVTNVTETDGIINVVASNLVVDDIPELPQNKVTGLETALAGKQDALEFDGTPSADNKVATMESIRNAVANLNGAMHFVGTSTTDPNQGNATVEGVDSFKTGDVVLYGYDEYIYDGTKWVALGNESIYAKDAEVDAEFAKVRQELANEKLALQGEIDSDISAARGLITQEIADAIGNLDSAITEEAGKVISSFEIADGKIVADSVKKTTLAEVATSGKFEDLSQNGLLIINCGTANTNITAADAGAIVIPGTV